MSASQHRKPAAWRKSGNGVAAGVIGCQWRRNQLSAMLAKLEAINANEKGGEMKAIIVWQSLGYQYKSSSA
jgi:hypothetical protein